MRLLLLSLLATTIMMSCQSTATTTLVEPTTSSKLPALFERTGELASAVEWPKTKAKVQELMTRIEAEPTNTKARLQLATIYITEARITGEHPYYYPAIHTILDGVLQIDPQNFEGTVLKSSVLMSQHRFKEALQTAERAKTINPNEAYVYGILVDANVELGNYDAAIAASDKMQALKPSLESYSRASYLREIFGDYKGAIDAMTLAAQAGLPGSEPQCWSLKTLAELYRHVGNINQAEFQYKKILAMRPSYAFAISGLASIESERKHYDAALALLDTAASIMPEFSFYEQKADIYALQGQTEKASQTYAQVKTMLDEDAKSGHAVDLELARLYIKTNQLDLAKKHAMIEYAIRPNNIDVNKELAWITFKENNIAKAKQYLEVAKKTGSKDPELSARAAIIERS
jgi:tetratricopeptide (TPR) repeat protein